MSDYNWLNDDDDDEDDVRSSASDALREARKAAKANSRAAKAAQEELAKLRSELHERKIADAIREKGLNPKIARLAKDVPAEELDAFLDDYADVFGVSAGNGNGSQMTSDGSSADQLDPNLAALQRISGGQAAQPSSATKAENIEQQILSAQTPQELNRLLFGNPNGPAVF
jgi:hypothetical protein